MTGWMSRVERAYRKGEGIYKGGLLPHLFYPRAYCRRQLNDRHLGQVRGVGCSSLVLNGFAR